MKLKNALAAIGIASTLWGCASVPKTDPKVELNRRTATIDSAKEFSVLLTSDIHLDPFSDPALAQKLAQAPVAEWESIFKSSASSSPSPYGSDSNYALFASALEAMKAQNPNPSLIVISGDFLVHKMNQKFAALPMAAEADYDDLVNKSIQFAALEFQKAFPKSQIVSALGNNDSACGDYMSQPRSPFLKTFAGAWLPSIHHRDGLDDFSNEAANEGFYSVRFDSGNSKERLRLLVLNGTYWSIRYANSCGSASDTPGRDQLEWLDAQLSASEKANEPVWIVNHIPAGYDAWATKRKIQKKSCKPKNFVRFYDTQSDSKYLEILRKHSANIHLVISGHTHMNEIRLLFGQTPTPIPAILVPSISPIHNNNPAFELLTVSRETLEVENAEVYVGNLAEAKPVLSWSKEYSFVDTYQQSNLSSASLAALAKQLQTDGPVKERFQRNFYSGGTDYATEIKNWAPYLCSFTQTDDAGYEACVCP